MKTLNFLILALTLSALACKNDKKSAEISTNAPSETPKTLKITLNAKSNTEVSGNAVFSEENGIVTLTAVVSGLNPGGTHAIHLHEKADCSSDDGTSAGGHWNPTAEPHGKWGDKAGYHRGDIGNFIADENGNGSITFATNQWCIGCEDDNKNIIGKSVIVHAGEDDFTSQPTGAAGAPFSCAGIIEY